MIKQGCLALLCLAISCNLFADISEKDRKAVNAAVATLSKKVEKDLKVNDIKSTPLPNILQVTVDSNIIYVSKDGKYLISGDIIDLAKDRDSWSLTENAMRSIRKKILANQDIKEMIVYPAKGKLLGVAYVFTDIDCPYCHKLQENIDKYSDLGIEIHYLAFPRAGPGSESFKKAVTVWCSSDKQRDLTLAMKGTSIPENLCANNPVQKQFDLSRQLGIYGTPTFILENGVKIGGLVSAEDLAKILKEQKSNIKDNN